MEASIRAEVMAALKEERQRIARAGGLARAQNMTAAQRRKSALKASKAAALARSKRAKSKKADRYATLTE